MSAPSSPQLKSPLHQKRRHSCDDLLSPNRPSPDPSHLQGPQPAITITTPNRRNNTLPVPTLYQQELDESDESSSESELDLSDSDMPHPPTANLGAVNSLADMLKGGGTSSEFGGDEEDEVEPREGDRQGTPSGGGNVGKFSRFKGKFLQTVKSSTSSLLSRPRSRSPQPINEAPREDNSHLKRRSPSPTPLEGEVTKGPSSNLQLSSVRQRFKVNSPSLWRKMRKNSPAPPSEEELSRAQAQRNCRSRIIYIT